ncbi:MAG: hypothetical protein KDB14_14000 [Planctomycetales bacterium]|nr:hypothetical protein [Planctomycetales bacterium]
MQHPTVVGLGEILWDVFPDGARFGGAPANFIGNVAGVADESWECQMVGVVGDDDFGRQSLERLRELGVGAEYVVIDSHPTGQVNVDVDERGVASYRFADDAAWDHFAFHEEWRPLAARIDAVCFGSLGQRSSESHAGVLEFLDAIPAQALRVFDINLRAPHYTSEVIDASLSRANALKLNEEELPVLQELYALEGDLHDQLHQLLLSFGLRWVALTRGANGSLVLSADEFSVLRGEPVEVVDTVGAGDAFTAALVCSLLSGESLSSAHRAAAALAAKICGQAGATLGG